MGQPTDRDAEHDHAEQNAGQDAPVDPGEGTTTAPPSVSDAVEEGAPDAVEEPRDDVTGTPVGDPATDDVATSPAGEPEAPAPAEAGDDGPVGAVPAEDTDAVPAEDTDAVPAEDADATSPVGDVVEPSVAEGSGVPSPGQRTGPDVPVDVPDADEAADPVVEPAEPAEPVGSSEGVEPVEQPAAQGAETAIDVDVDVDVDVDDDDVDDDDDDTPYVPRVFAFDPDAPVAEQDQVAEVETPAPPATDAPGGPAGPAVSTDTPDTTDTPEPTGTPEAAGPAEDAGPTEPAVPADAAGAAAEPAEPVEPAVLAVPVEPAVPVERAVPVEPAGPAEPAAAAEAAAADTAAAETAVPAEPAAPEPAAPASTPEAEEATGGADDTEVIPPVSAEPWERPAGVTAALAASVARPAAPEAPAPEQGRPRAPWEPTPDPTDGPSTQRMPATAGTAAGARPATGFTPVPPDDSRDTSPFEGFEEDGPRHGWVRGLLWTGLGVLVLGGLYTGAQWYFSDKVPSGTTVAGVDIGGMDRAAAQAELESTVGARAAEPVELTAGDATTTMDPAEAGLAFDAAATAEELTSFSMKPTRLWEHLFGGEPQDPVVTVDQDALDAQVETLQGSLEVEPVDGSVQYVDGEPSATAAVDGTALVVDEIPGEITASWLVTDAPIQLSTEPVAPDVTQEETDAALVEAQTVVSDPVVVSVGGQDPELPPDVLADAASYPVVDGDLQLSLDGPTLVDAVVDRTDDLLTAADDAHFVFVSGKPEIEGGEPGTTIDPDELSGAVATAATGDDRTATVELVESDPEQSVEALEKLGVKERVSEFATPLTNDAIRTENLRVGAAKVDGTLVRPGETFSLTETLSPITAAGGYHSSGIVQDGKHTEGIGGGLSQMATTSYNAGFFAGLEDVEHRQHSYWFSRYPAGREATIFVGSLDMRFKNDTPYGVLMQSWVSGGELHVAIWSTKYYTVETTASPKSNVVEPTTVTHTGADCVPMGAGNPGFSITNYRKVYLDGELVKDEADHWTYKPDNAVKCE